MRRYFVILLLLLPVGGYAGCSFTTGQLGGTGSQSVDIGPDGVKPTNDHD